MSWPIKLKTKPMFADINPLRKFPLIVWQQTEDYKKELEEANERLRELAHKWRERYGGDSYLNGCRRQRKRQ